MAELTVEGDGLIDGVATNLGIVEITKVLIRHFKFTEGLYDITFGIRIGVGGVGPSPSEVLPGATFGIETIGLRKVETASHQTVDASSVWEIVEKAAGAPSKKRTPSVKKSD